MLMKPFKRLVYVAKNETGSISMYVLIFMVFFLPFVIWVGVNLPLKMEGTHEVKQMTSNTADSIISRLDESELTKGKVVIDYAKAKPIAEDMVRSTLKLDENDMPSGEGMLQDQIPIKVSDLSGLESLPKTSEGAYELPSEAGVFIYIVNNPTEKKILIDKLSPIDKTTAIVQANIPFGKVSMINGKTMIHKTGVSEAGLHVDRQS